MIALLLASILFHESFSSGMPDWWTEGGEEVWVEDGRLHVRADSPKASVATVWNRKRHAGDFDVELDAHVVASSVEANNINLFFSYSDPTGVPLEQTRDGRSSAEYGLYHKLNGYIITFLNDPKGAPKQDPGLARIRIRRNPGFKLLAEAWAYHCRAGRTYRLRVTKREGEIRFAVDGKELLKAVDPEPLPGGYFGLRTFRTHLWWDDIRLTNRSVR